MLDNDTLYEMLDTVTDGVYLVDRQRTIRWWSKGAERISGFAAADVVGRRCNANILMHVDAEGRSLCTSGCPLLSSMSTDHREQAQVYLHHKDGHRVPVEVRVAPLRREDGRITGAVEAFTDESAHTADQDRIAALEQLAYVDPLTGVANRRMVIETLEMRLEEHRRYGWPVGLVFLDVDHFKRFNDTWGHEVGDAVLKQVANTLKSCCRPFDTVGRWGGEEFVVIAANVDADGLREVAERFRVMIAQSGIKVDDRIVGVTASFGAALCLEGDTADSLVQRADTLMYDSKQAGRNRVSLAA